MSTFDCFELLLFFSRQRHVRRRNFKNVNLFLFNCEERDPSKLQHVHMNDILQIEDLLQLKAFLYEIDFVDRDLIGELALQSIQKIDNRVQLLHYNNQICYVNNINAILNFFRRSAYQAFFSETGNLERHLVSRSEFTMIANFRRKLYFSHCLGRPSFLKQQYKQMMQQPLQSDPGVCGFYKIYSAFHLFMFRQRKKSWNACYRYNFFHR